MFDFVGPVLVVVVVVGGVMDPPPKKIFKHADGSGRVTSDGVTHTLPHTTLWGRTHTSIMSKLLKILNHTSTSVCPPAGAATAAVAVNYKKMSISL